MWLDSIKDIEKVTSGALYTLWTKYGKWESEGPSLFEKREVLRETGDRRASADVPTSYFVLKLSEEDRSGYRLSISSILIRENYRQVLNNICYFATHNVLPPPNLLNASPSEEFENPFFNTEPSNLTAAVTLIGHPGIGKQCDAVQRSSEFVIFHLVLMIRQKSLAACRACTPYPRRSSNYILLQRQYLSRL
jgi:hypothetical protein